MNEELMKSVLKYLLCVFAIVMWSNAIAVAQAVDTPPAKQITTQDSQSGKPIIARIWHGRTRTSDADEYYLYLYEAGIKKIKSTVGNLGVEVLRKKGDRVTEFIVISYWESIEAIQRFAGKDISKTHNLPKDHLYLLELEPTVKHFEVMFSEK